MRDTTLLFLVKKVGDKITEVCLAQKRRGFGVGKWNGVGGKVEKGESIIDGLKRESSEEISVVPTNFKKAAELTFIFPHKPEWNQLVHTYIAEEWEGVPVESEEMSPKWFGLKEIPFENMWPDDPFWLPKVLAGERVKATFSFDDKDRILEQKVEVVSGLAG